jgi:hypothetical protein|tara:strand:+ start:3256 stop:4692 length:1437 start_codon:yes stop_codon:yes gene_type:complete
MNLLAKILLLLICSIVTPPAAPAVSDDLLSSAREFVSFVRSDDLNADNCAATINAIYSDLFSKPGNTYNLPAVRENVTALTELTWEIRLALRQRLKQFFGAGNLGRPCAEAIKTALRASRSVEEYLVLNFLDVGTVAPLSGSLPHLQAVGSFTGPQDLQSGDVLLSRGNAYTSAAIARMGDNDTQFSHLSLVYTDEDRETYTIESWIEVGLFVKRYKEGHYGDGHARVVVYRYEDATLAHRAAKYMYDLVRQKGSEPIPYDFRMDVDDPSALFCAEVVSQGFKNASDGDVVIPLITTQFPLPGGDFREEIGIAFAGGFTPADIEIDPRFDLVAEWKDYSKLYDSHLKDAVLTRSFAWMEDPDLNYRFDYSWYEAGLTELLVAARKWSWLSGVTGLDKRLTQTMQPSAINVFWALDRTMEAIYQYLKSADADFRRDKRRGMIVNELYASLDELRLQDYNRYEREREGIIFHEYFRPVSE